VLAHLENFNFAALLQNLDMRHVLLFYLLDCYLKFRVFMSSKLDHTELSLSERFVQVVESEHIRVSHRCHHLTLPHGHFVFSLEEHEA